MLYYHNSAHRDQILVLNAVTLILHKQNILYKKHYFIWENQQEDVWMFMLHRLWKAINDRLVNYLNEVAIHGKDIRINEPLLATRRITQYVLSLLRASLKAIPLLKRCSLDLRRIILMTQMPWVGFKPTTLVTQSKGLTALP